MPATARSELLELLTRLAAQRRTYPVTPNWETDWPVVVTRWPKDRYL